MAKQGPQRYPGASTEDFWQQKFGGAAMEVNVVVWHSTEGRTLPDYAQGSKAPTFTALPDFGAKKLRWFQHFDFDVSSRALRNKPGGVETNTLNVAQVELVGTCNPVQHTEWKQAGKAHLYTAELPDWAVRDLAAFARWARDKHNVPLTAVASWKPFKPGGANDSVRMAAATWRAFKGHCGHQHVPENDHGDPGAFPMAKILAVAKNGGLPAPVSVHTVRKGDTLFGIARKHGLSLAALLAANPAFKSHPDVVPVGARLTIPKS